MFALIPPNALPLLLPADVKAYSTSENPCGLSVLKIDARAIASPIAIEAPARTSVGVVRMYSETSFISRAVIFFFRYSGVRPTIRPATNTVRTASTSMP
jgi:hypothetical protein